MNNFQFHALLLKDKPFLKSLYNGRQGRQVLKKATLAQLDLVIQILHAISSGDISLSKSAYSRLKKRGKLHAINEAVQTEENLKGMLAKSKVEKLHFLLNFSLFFDSLLHNLFFIKDRKPLSSC